LGIEKDAKVEDIEIDLTEEDEDENKKGKNNLKKKFQILIFFI
jgi:hypothetical protein